MTASKDDVLAALGKISGPGGVPLPASGKLSEIVATDGKVFFSITVDAGEVEEWETVRERERYYVINYYSIAKLNPTGIIPKGTPVDLGQPHDRARLAA